ncbi:RNA-directed DNA polymerase, eukaryota, reverse transcriptase zinc-binding domain protein [Tanacetum coccineum]
MSGCILFVGGRLVVGVGAKDLWNACKQYEHVVDAFIPNKRSKAGKRFGFVRFIKVFDVERLVGNLCTVWIGRHRIHANAARFHRPKGSTSSHQPAMKGKIRDSSIGNTKDNGHRDDVSSYANVVKNQSQGNGENDSKPVLVLDDSCVNTQDYSCCLNGKVKEVGVLENLKVALGNEGFTDIDLRYMGGLWVMIAFDSVEAKEKFLLSTGVCSWFSQLIQASSEFITDERVTMVEIEGIPLKVWNKNTFIRIASMWGTLLNVKNLERKNYHCKRLCVLTKNLDYQNNEESDSEDEECDEVFKKDFGESDEEVQGENDVSMVSDTKVEEENPKSKDGVVSSEQNGKQSEDPFNIYSLLNNKEASTKESLEYPPGFTPRDNDVENVEMDYQKDNCDGGESMDSDHYRESEGSRKGGSILMLMDELVKVGQTMGYNMDGCMKNIEEIIESQGVDGVNFLTLQETKMESIDLFEIKRCWGNFAFDYVHSASVGKSGGILCVWDPNAFKKLNSTASDYFVMIQGNWVSNGKLLLIISVYAPQELSEKKSLWDYLCHVIDNWKGSVIIMGDFNEVRNKNERFGTIFNVHGANAFNSFISMANLEEVPLGGCSFTWCHRSASKMSKLDRFLMSESLLRFCELVIVVCVKLGDNSNAMSTCMKLGTRDLEMIIDKGDASSDTLHKRAEVVKSIQEVDKLCAMEASQKAKIKWAIEGDENSKYYHGILNKKRNQLIIRGVMVEGLVSYSLAIDGNMVSGFQRLVTSPFGEAFLQEEEDLWHGDMVLKQRYPRLYVLEVKKTVDVASKLSQENLTWWYWTLDGSGEFSVASARKVIDDNRFLEVSTQTRWIKAVPIKVNIHAWKSGFQNCAWQQKFRELRQSRFDLLVLRCSFFYRERAAGMYLLLPYALAQVIIESISVPV